MMQDGPGKQKVWLVADDYGLSPAVSRGIRQLIGAGRISGTGCMTLFPEWKDEAALLASCVGHENAAIGLHLTLTDFPPLSGSSALAPAGKMPPLKTLIWQASTQQAMGCDIHRELDAQLDAFTAAMGHAPHYLDGHQHVHFLPPVRQWLKDKAAFFRSQDTVPWLRGAPSTAFATGALMKAKVAFARGLALGFDRAMRQAGYRVAGPLAGFYDWSDGNDFARAMTRLGPGLPEGAVVMCHPGEIDDCLKNRDILVAARKIELDALLEQPFFALCQRAGAAG
jgi:chitin disaccharide deacetylase